MHHVSQLKTGIRGASYWSCPQEPFRVVAALQQQTLRRSDTSRGPKRAMIAGLWYQSPLISRLSSLSLLLRLH